MKLRKLAIAAASAALVLCASAPAQAFDLKNILSQAGQVMTDGNTITDMIQGVFAKTNLTVDDIAGQWTSTAPAVSFQSENLLKKAGGIAAASAMEQKIKPYYQKYGLDGAVLTINHDGSFTLKTKRLSLSGTVTAAENNSQANFIFNFRALGLIPLGNIEAYVSKTGNSIDVMFDASKLQTLLSAIASFSKIQLAQTASSLLSSYDGICVGFKMSLTGQAADAASTTTTTTTQSAGTGLLQNILTGGSATTTQAPAVSADTTTNEAAGQTINLLRNILSGKKK